MTVGPECPQAVVWLCDPAAANGGAECYCQIWFDVVGLYIQSPWKHRSTCPVIGICLCRTLGEHWHSPVAKGEGAWSEGSL